jgi:RNA polymerase sigma factor (sigma-70 family)
MMHTAADTGDFEGLVYATAARYAPYLDDSLEDIQQELRVKVWRALIAYDPARSGLSPENYVFGCVYNRVKDLLKQQSRLNDRRNGAQLYVEDVAAANPSAFELRYFTEDPELVYIEVEDDPTLLPSTLTRFQAQVIHLLLLDFSQAEAARVLGVSRGRVRAAHLAVRDKMADWAPPLDDAGPELAPADAAPCLAA